MKQKQQQQQMQTIARLEALTHCRPKRTIAQLKQLLLLDIQPKQRVFRALPPAVAAAVKLRYCCKTKPPLPRELLREIARALPFKQLFFRRRTLLRSALLGSFGSYLLEHYWAIRKQASLTRRPFSCSCDQSRLEQFLEEEQGQPRKRFAHFLYGFIQEQDAYFQSVVGSEFSAEYGQILGKESVKARLKKGKRSGRQQKLNYKSMQCRGKQWRRFGGQAAGGSRH